MGHEGRDLCEGLDAAEGLCEGKDLEVLKESSGRVDVALDAEGEHAAKARLLLLGNLVVGVRGQA